MDEILAFSGRLQESFFVTTLSLLEAAHELGPWESATVLRPEWHNPLSSQGTGIELITGRTLTELIATYHEKLTALIFIAQFAVVRCKKAKIEGLFDEKPLDSLNRDPSDMIWHTDHDHRTRGDISVVVGESTIPTGLASKEVVHNLLLERGLSDNLEPTSHPFDRRKDFWMEENGVASNWLMRMHIGKREHWSKEAKEVDELAMGLAAVNDSSSILWYGKNPPELKDRDTAIFTTGLHLHCKQPTPDHYKPRDGNKRRYQLLTSEHIRNRVKQMLEDCDFGETDPPNTDADWFKGLGK